MALMRNFKDDYAVLRWALHPEKLKLTWEPPNRTAPIFESD